MLTQRLLLLAATALIAAAAPLGAQPQAPAAKAPAAQSQGDAPTRLDTAKDWSAYRYAEAKENVCYLVGRPAKMEPAADSRNAAFLVTHNNRDKTSDVVSIVPDYAYKDGSAVELDVDGRKFDLFTKGNRAWARDAAADKAVVEAMRKGKAAIVKGVPAKGGPTTDAYSLAGFAQMLGAADKACAIKR